MANENDSGTESNGAVTEPAGPSADELTKLQEELAKTKSDFLYLRAEFDNYRKHAIKERSDLIKYGGERILRELLNVVDNFERALSVELTPDSINKYHEGIQLIANELASLLKTFGVEMINSEGQPFDPTAHEALGSEPTTSVPAGHVSRVFKKAYKLHDKLIRPAQVMVASEPKE